MVNRLYAYVWPDSVLFGIFVSDYITVEEELQNMNQPKTADYMIPRKLGGGIISTKGNSVSEECQGILRIFHMENANSVLDVKETVLKYKR